MGLSISLALPNGGLKLVRHFRGALVAERTELGLCGRFLLLSSMKPRARGGA